MQNPKPVSGSTFQAGDPFPRSIAQFLFALLFAFAVAPACAIAGLSNFGVEFDPPLPVSHRPVALLLSADSTDQCTPRFVKATVNGTSIDVILYNPTLQSCTQVPLPWSERVELGYLAAGAYVATMRIVALPPPLPSSSTILGAVDLEVADPLAIAVHGASPRKTVCVNRTTGQRVVLKGEPGPWDCEAAGLVVQSGDRVGIRVFGQAP